MTGRYPVHGDIYDVSPCSSGPGPGPGSGPCLEAMSQPGGGGSRAIPITGLSLEFALCSFPYCGLHDGQPCPAGWLHKRGPCGTVTRMQMELFPR